jgi:siroheme synthase-like protein
VAERKVFKLLEYRADVLLVSPAATESLTELEARGIMRWRKRPAEAADLDGAVLAFVATDDAEVNATITAAARERGIPVNRADAADDCDMIVPSSFERGNLQVAILSQGTSPALTRWLRRRIESTLDAELAAFSEVFGEIREKIRNLPLTQRQRAELLNKLLESDVFDVLAKEGIRSATVHARDLLNQYAREMIPVIDEGAEI